MMNNQHQLGRREHPYRTQHHPGGRIEPVTGGHQHIIGKRRHTLHTVIRVYRSRFGHSQRPPPVGGPIAIGPQPQHGVAIQQRLHQRHRIGMVHSRRSTQHHRLVELLNRAVHGCQPAHDRCRQNLTNTLINHAVARAGQHSNAGHPSHGPLGQNIAWPADHTRSTGPRDHLHRRNAVPTEVEEGVVDADAFDP
ncbi:hypothetical protein MSIMFB_05694 [Mycobacterium simulans]|uniref:Uncharacterized protein n=1 Tax=Mycobacterium simulans TaxID=627089 RepID=A0A7Z7ISZ8_9MYCO|nr:hypothetical protein MSIMFB_05694 [Mycobacterium simulans]